MASLGDNVVLDATLVSVFLLVLARLGGWMLVTPLLGSRATAPLGRLALSVALAIVLTVPASQDAVVPETLGGFIQAAFVQFLLGMGYGFVTGLFLYVAGMAGSLIDLMSGLGYAAIVDPASGQTVAAFSRFFSMTFLALLFATDAYLTIIYGLGQTFSTIPISSTVPFDPSSVDQIAQTVSSTLGSAVLVASPLIGVLLLTEVALAVAARFFPQANVAFLGLSIKAFLALSMSAAVLIMLPARLSGWLAAGTDLASGVFR